MTEKEQFLELILKERVERMVDEVLSQAMLDTGRNIPEAVGAFDKNWTKRVFVAEIKAKNGGNADELAEDIRGELINALESLSDGRDFAIVNIGAEWNEGILCATYVLSAEKSLFAEWEEVTDDDILYTVQEYITENEDSSLELDNIYLRNGKINANANANIEVQLFDHVNLNPIK